jgi:hypothetical protein
VTVRRDVHGVPVEIACDRVEAAELVGRRLASFPSTEAAELRISLTTQTVHRELDAPASSRVVHESANGVVLYADELDELWIRYGETAYAHCRPAEGIASILVDWCDPQAEWVASRPLLTVTLLELLKRHSLFGVHAAAVACGDKCVLLAGSSGAGKSTAALALLLAGWSVLGDDLVFLRSEDRLEICAFADEIDASLATFTLLPELGEPGEWPKLAGYGKHQVDPIQLRADSVSRRATPALLILAAVGTGDHEVLPVSPADVLLELVPNVLLTEPHIAQAQLDALGELANSIPAYRVAVGPRIHSLAAVVERLLLS